MNRPTPVKTDNFFLLIFRALRHRRVPIALRIADISDPAELNTRAAALSLELDTPITPGFEALVFKASRGIEDIYELTYIRKDGSRLSAMVSVTALRNRHDTIIGYLLIGTANTARLSRLAGLPDSAFKHDGQLTKRAERPARYVFTCPLGIVIRCIRW